MGKNSFPNLKKRELLVVACENDSADIPPRPFGKVNMSFDSCWYVAIVYIAACR